MVGRHVPDDCLCMVGNIMKLELALAEGLISSFTQQLAFLFIKSF